MNKIYEIANFITNNEVNLLKDHCYSWANKEFIAGQGKFTGQLISNQRFGNVDNNVVDSVLGNKIKRIFGTDFKIVELDFAELFFPWDIHGDYERPLKGKEPWYTIILPLNDSPSRTIIFHETGNYDGFYRFKKMSAKTQMPVDQEFWDNNLSHCWDEDREYLSLRYVSQEWRAGSMLAFPRNVFHSSDNFHLKTDSPKVFLQILIDKI